LESDAAAAMAGAILGSGGGAFTMQNKTAAQIRETLAVDHIKDHIKTKHGQWYQTLAVC
jgi:hypothetical protein